MGDNQKAIVVSIPPGVAHGCKVLQGPASLYYRTSHGYDPDDEGRWVHDDPEIGCDWLRPPFIS
jgi:dTDP-4-dehydrorhamnose 3,5-epimerase